MYLQKFTKEIEEIHIEEFRDFAAEAVGLFEDDYFTETDILLIKSTIKYSKRLLRAIEADDIIFDMFTVAGLLYLGCKWDEHEETPYHVVKVRAEFLRFQSIIGREKYNDVCLLIESQEGLNSIIPQLEPRLDDSVYSWIFPFAVQLAREDVVDD